MTLTKRILSCLLLFFAIPIEHGFSQDSTAAQSRQPEITHKAFANIYTSFYFGTSGRIVPRAAFEMPTALLGYSATIQEKLKATLIYDVTRTTSAINVSDSNGRGHQVNFIEGSKFTAFLKMAEIKYTLSRVVGFRVGQLLNTQYLTVQDKFWGYRYVYFTYQEVHRYGMPADFGAQLDLKFNRNVLSQLSVTNGEGPFRYQDQNARFLIAHNIEVSPVEGLILKLYTDYSQTPDTASLAKDRYAISGFAGYRAPRFKLGAEFNMVVNWGYRKNRDHFGISAYGGLAVSERVEVFGRYDYINRSAVLSIAKGNMIIAGIQYQPVKNLFCSLNFRSLNPGQKIWAYASFGVSF